MDKLRLGLMEAIPAEAAVVDTSVQMAGTQRVVEVGENKEEAEVENKDLMDENSMDDKMAPLVGAGVGVFVGELVDGLVDERKDKLVVAESVEGEMESNEGGLKTADFLQT